MASPILRARSFCKSLHDGDPGLGAFTPGGPPSLYGTVFALMTRHYLGEDATLSDRTRDAVLGMQSAETGYFEGPDIEAWNPEAAWDRLHLVQHLTCHVLPALDLAGVSARPLTAARQYTDLGVLDAWLAQRDWRHAWLEGNNLLFVGQMLAHLRDVERVPEAGAAIERWFAWHEAQFDPDTGMWGTNGFCGPFEAMCGAYHQLLLFVWAGRDLPHDRALIDTTLALQHPDGGFAPNGGGGACEDVDAVDILVNATKRTDYRRGDVRAALRATMRLILDLQNEDGGFPYSRSGPWVYMGMGTTSAAPGASHAFGTWFRVHTLALIAEIVEDPVFEGVPFRFNRSVSMGWHRAWSSEERRRAAIGSEVSYRFGLGARLWVWRVRRLLGRTKSRLKRLGS